METEDRRQYSRAAKGSVDGDIQPVRKYVYTDAFGGDDEEKSFNDLLSTELAFH